MNKILFVMIAAGGSIISRLDAGVQPAFSPLPPQTIQVGGWIQRHIHEDASNGWVYQRNRLSEEEGIYTWWPSCGLIRPHYPFPEPNTSEPGVISKNSSWKQYQPFYRTLIEKTGSYGEGEFEAHWMDMMFRQVWIGGYKQKEALSRRCVEDLLASVDQTGYIGTNPIGHRYRGTLLSPWGASSASTEAAGMGCVYDALLTYYRFTGDARIPPAIEKAADAFIETTSKDSKIGLWAGGLMAIPLAKLYGMTGDQKYLDKALFCWKRDIDVMKGQAQPGDFRIFKQHGATMGIVVLATLELYRVTGDKQYLDIARDINDQVVKFALQSHGAPTGHLETLIPASPRENTEGCETAWWSMDWMEFLSLTGEAGYADRAEKCVLNALPGGRGKDAATSSYFMRTNQLFAATGKNCGTNYGVTQGCDCCLGNLGRVMPILGEHMIMARKDGGFAIPFYGPCSAQGALPDGSTVRLTQKTDYPFDDSVKISVEIQNKKARFPIVLRKPGWCTHYKLKVNGWTFAAPLKDSWIILDRTWKSGDAIELTLPMEVRVSRDKEGLAVVERGPLLYALPVQGRKIPLDKWGSFEQIVTPQDQWNYALTVDMANPVESFRVKTMRVRKGAHVWEYPQTILEVDACKLADWKFEKSIEQLHPVESFDAPEPNVPLQPFKTLGPRKKITLVPFGCTILRMTHLPVMP